MRGKTFYLILTAFFCLCLGLVWGRATAQSDRAVLGEKRVTINTIPKEYGRLVTVDRSGEGPVLYFEAEDGTIRIVVANYGANYGSLNFRAVTVPRN